MASAKLFAGLSAFGCGAVIALVVLVSLEHVHAARTITLHTCAAADGTLHVTGPAMPCQPEQRRVRLQLTREEDKDCKEDDGRVERLERRLRDLEARDRRGTMRGRRVVAPFEVVRKKGEGHARVLRIEEQNVTFYNGDEKPVVWIVADNSGGMLHTQSVAGDREARIAAQDKRAHVLIKENDQDRIDLGRQATGRYSLQVFGAQNKMVAGMGQSEAGSGLMHVADAAGAIRASLFVSSDNGSGRLEVRNGSGTVVGMMSANPQAGLLQLTDGGGRLMVEAGVGANNGAGVVRTGPNMRNSGVGLVGLVPSYILGKP
jgi:hypothetical protein